MKTNNSIDLDPEYPDIEILQSFATVAFDTCNLLVNPNQLINGLWSFPRTAPDAWDPNIF